MADPVEVMARVMIGDERYEALPGISTYLERKSMPHGAEWSDRDELHADLTRALSALDGAGFSVVPKGLVKALDQSRIAIDDWLNTYASELCAEARVKEAWDRIGAAGGTLAYIAAIQHQNRAMLSAAQVKV